MSQSDQNVPVLRIEPDRLSAFGQLAWISCCLNLLKLASVPHRLEVVSVGLDTSVRELLASDFLERFFPGHKVRLVEASPSPDPAETFACISGSEVLTTQLLERFERVLVRPSALPRKIDTGLFILEKATGAFLQPLSQAIDEGLLKAADCEWPAFREGVSPSGRQVTLMTSLFKGDQFLEQFLANSERLEEYDRHEHFLVRAASPGNEHEQLLDFAYRHPTAVYINLAKDPGLYDVWNLIISLASGRYLSNANIDDRRSPEHLSKLVPVLESNSGVDVASAALRVWHLPNTPWETSGNCKVWYASDQHPNGEYDWKDLFRTTPDGNIASRNMPHCMPVWRRSMHARHGLFRENAFGPSADWEFWLRSGVRGSRFYLHQEPLGLYLKSPESYWNVAGGHVDFDARIVDRYYPKQGGNAVVEPENTDLDELNKLARPPARFQYFHRLVQLVAVTLCTGGDRAVLTRFDKDALAAFGIKDFCASAEHFARKAPVVTEQIAFDCAVACLSRVSSAKVGGELFAVWHAMFADYAGVSATDEAMLATARLYWMQQDQDAAWRLMKAAWQQRGVRFWQVMRALFHFELSLPRIAETLCAGAMTVPPRVDDAASVSLWYYPDFRNNAYQANLYAPLRAAGATVQAIDRNDTVDIEPAKKKARTILHLHWIHTVFARRKGQKPELAAREFLAEVKRAKERGVRVLWTVHNYVNHDGRHRAIELKLRRELAALVDDVYLHHPLISDELDWLPEHVVPKLIEHGSYNLAEDWLTQQQRARATLGLPSTAKVIACAGQIRPYKELEVWLPQLLEWVSRTPDAWLLVLGQVKSEAVHETLSSSPERVRVVDRLLPEDEMDEYLCAADFGFLSYASILTSGTLFHMLSRALPVIAPTKGTIPAYVVDGWNGYLYQDKHSLDAALDELDRLNPETIEQLHNNALEAARKLPWEFRLEPEREQKLLDTLRNIARRSRGWQIVRRVTRKLFSEKQG